MTNNEYMTGVDAAFMKRYPEIYNELKLVDELIKKSIESRNSLLSSVVDELVAAGGKRLRPAFVIMGAKFGRYDRKKVLHAAGAFEILHTATLVHDDIIDNSSFRRGKLTVSEKYGTEMAIYTGDYLFTKAVLMLSQGIAADKLDIIARGMKTICEGEVDQYRDRFEVNISVTSYLKRISRKTAILFSAAASLGASIGKCPQNVVHELGRFGLNYGIAFQIRDDLMDYLSDEKKEGKPVASDLAKGNLTLPAIFAIRKSKQAEKVLETLVVKKGTAPASEVMAALDMVKELGGIEDSRRLLDSYIERGLARLEKLPKNKYRDIFCDLIKELRV